MRVFALVLVMAVAANAAGLRKGTDDDTPLDIVNEKEAETDAGCDGVQCGHVPKDGGAWTLRPPSLFRQAGTKRNLPPGPSSARNL